MHKGGKGGGVEIHTSPPLEKHTRGGGGVTHNMGCDAHHIKSYHVHSHRSSYRGGTHSKNKDTTRKKITVEIKMTSKTF